MNKRHLINTASIMIFKKPPNLLSNLVNKQTPFPIIQRTHSAWHQLTLHAKDTPEQHFPSISYLRTVPFSLPLKPVVL